MGRIHEAMRRAEQEGGVRLGLRSDAQQVAHKTITKTGAEFGPANLSPQQGETSKVANQPVQGLGHFAEAKTAPDARLVALSGQIYGELTERLGRLKTPSAPEGKDALRAVLITSATSGEGKSMTAANLAISLSRERGWRVLLVDANLRNPVIPKLLGLAGGTGLSELLRGEAAAGDCIIKTDINNLFVVTAGTHFGNPTELLNTRRMSDFLALAKSQFDWVLLDSSAILTAPDADLLAAFSDGVVVVAGAFQTSADSTLEALRNFSADNILGLVYNGLNAPRASVNRKLAKQVRRANPLRQLGRRITGIGIS